jgi:hypothetical protein
VRLARIAVERRRRRQDRNPQAYIAHDRISNSSVARDYIKDGMTRDEQLFFSSEVDEQEAA